MPEYWHRMYPQKCNISLLVEGPEVNIPTWNIATDINVPEKDGSEMSYSCQRHENLSKYPTAGPRREVCMGKLSAQRFVYPSITDLYNGTGYGFSRVSASVCLFT